MSCRRRERKQKRGHLVDIISKNQFAMEPRTMPMRRGLLTVGGGYAATAQALSMQTESLKEAEFLDY